MNGGARLDVLNEWKLSPLAVAYLKGITNQKFNSNIANLVVVNSLFDLLIHYVQIQRYYPKIMSQLLEIKNLDTTPFQKDSYLNSLFVMLILIHN